MKKILFLFILLCGWVVAPAQTFDGIDVSHHQGDINWKKVAKNKDIQFVYIKATEGKTYVDPCYQKNIKDARAAGLKVGSYHYFRMTSSPQAQFENMKKHIKKSEQDLIPMIDVELIGKYVVDGYSAQKTRKALKQFLKLVEDYYGVKPILYGTNRSYNEICGGEFTDYQTYIGRYGKNKPVLAHTPKTHHYTIWQYSEHGRIAGIPKDVDLCKFHPKASIQSLLYKKD